MDENRTSPLPTGPFVDPQTVQVLRALLTPVYLTAAPTYTPQQDGVMHIVKTGGLYYLYSYIDGAWRRSQMT